MITNVVQTFIKIKFEGDWGKLSRGKPFPSPCLSQLHGQSMSLYLSTIVTSQTSQTWWDTVPVLWYVESATSVPPFQRNDQNSRSDDADLDRPKSQVGPHTQRKANIWRSPFCETYKYTSVKHLRPFATAASQYRAAGSRVCLVIYLQKLFVEVAVHSFDSIIANAKIQKSNLPPMTWGSNSVRVPREDWLSC